MTTDEKNELVKARLSRAKSTIEEAELLIRNNFLMPQSTEFIMLAFMQ